MNDLERRIRDLPRPAPSEALDARVTALLARARSTGRLPQSRWTSLTPLAATALAAGLAGFAVGVGTGHWIAAPPAAPKIADARTDTERSTESHGAQATLVHLTDARISSGLDFSQSLEPFRVEPIDQEGS